MELPLPEWLVTFDDFPSKNDIPLKPTAPKPKAKIISDVLLAIGKARTNFYAEFFAYFIKKYKPNFSMYLKRK